MGYGFLGSLGIWFHWDNHSPCGLNSFGHTFHMSSAAVPVASIFMTSKALEGCRDVQFYSFKAVANFHYFGLVSLFLWHINLRGLFNAKAILLEEQWWYYLTHSWEDKGVHTFPKGICPKVNVIARPDFEFACYDFADHRFNHYTTGTSPLFWELLIYQMSDCVCGFTTPSNDYSLVLFCLYFL